MPLHAFLGSVSRQLSQEVTQHQDDPECYNDSADNYDAAYQTRNRSKDESHYQQGHQHHGRQRVDEDGHRHCQALNYVASKVVPRRKLLFLPPRDSANDLQPVTLLGKVHDGYEADYDPDNYLGDPTGIIQRELD